MFFTLFLSTQIGVSPCESWTLKGFFFIFFSLNCKNVNCSFMFVYLLSNLVNFLCGKIVTGPRGGYITKMLMV